MAESAVPSIVQTAVPLTAKELQVDPLELHELRVRIPVDLHRQLLSLKVLRGKSLAQTVSHALDDYFACHGRASTARKEDAGPTQ